MAKTATRNTREELRKLLDKCNPDGSVAYLLTRILKELRPPTHIRAAGNPAYIYWGIYRQIDQICLRVGPGYATMETDYAAEGLRSEEADVDLLEPGAFQQLKRHIRTMYARCDPNHRDEPTRSEYMRNRRVKARRTA
jgi:hypothetical protein